MNSRTFSSESVTEGHPDKICDQISDSILDAILAQDPKARVAVETMVTTGLVHVAGEITTEAYVEMPQLIRDKLVEIGYTSSDIGFDGESCGVSLSIGQQSPDIAMGVDKSLESKTGVAPDELGAGDQGIMFGYASDETPELMPAPILLAHRITQRLADVRREQAPELLRPDGKAQVTVSYQGSRVVSVDKVLVSSQHSPEFHHGDLSSLIIEQVISPVLIESGLDFQDCEYLVNPTGRFVIGGPKGDAGLTGRKIIVDTYGGSARHGGGAFSGKDPSKVDRSAAYAMRWVAKHIVAAGLAKRAELQVAYAIGVAAPVSMYLETFGTATVSEDSILAAVREVFDLRPQAIIDDLDLLRPIYAQTAAYGHFGRELPDFTWEATPRVEALLKAVR